MSKSIIHIISSMALVLILISVSTAQIKFGATLGITSSNLSVDPEDPDDPSLDSKTDFTLGAVLVYPLSDNLNLRSGASLTSKGAKFSEEEEGVKIEGGLKFSYLTVPLLAQYKFNSSATTPYLLGGLDIGLLMSADAEVTISGADFDDLTISIDIKDSTSSTDIAFSIGAGYMMEMGNATVYGEVLYSLGLLDIDNDDNVATKTKGIIIAVGYIF